MSTASTMRIMAADAPIASVSVSASVTVTISGADSAASGSAGDDDGEEKLDLATEETDGLPGAGDCGHVVPQPGDEDFSIIWISNTGQHTVSKINTQAPANSADYGRIQWVG